jgi:excisionase family DNA binding protein
VSDQRPVLLTADELAEALRVSRRTVDRMVVEGAPRIHVRGKLYRYNLTAVMAWCQARGVANASDTEVLH